MLHGPSSFIHLQRICGRFASAQILTEKKIVTVPTEKNCLDDETVILVLSALTWLYTVLKLRFIISWVRFLFFFSVSNPSVAGSLGDLFTWMQEKNWGIHLPVFWLLCHYVLSFINKIITELGFFVVISLLHPWVTSLPGWNKKTWAFICLFCDYFAIKFWV